MSVQTITLPSISSITKHIPYFDQYPSSSPSRYYQHRPSPPPSSHRQSSFYEETRPRIKMEDSHFSHQSSRPSSMVSELGVHCSDKNLLSWDELVKLLLSPGVENYLPAGHPLTLAIPCLHMADSWKRQNVQINQSPSSSNYQIHSSETSNAPLPHLASTPTPSTTTQSRPQTSHSQHYDHFNPSNRSNLPPLSVQIPIHSNSNHFNNNNNNRPSSSGQDLESQSVVSPSLPTPISGLSPSNTTSPTLPTLNKSDGADIDIQKATESLQVFWDPKLSRPVPAGHSGDGSHQRTKEPSADSERLYFSPESHFRVFRCGVEVFPWDGIGPGNDWLRGQLSAMNECRCGVFHFRHSNTTFKRPAVIREHLASCNTSEAVPDSLRRLCILQRDAEKTGNKRKREENGGSKGSKRAKISNASNVRSKPISQPISGRLPGTPPASDEDNNYPSR